MELDINKYKYSIIIPHKNIPKLLTRCLDSIPIRDDLEVIIVDDDSDPAIVDFDCFPGKARRNVKLVFSKDRLGAGHARNLGLAVASGEWLLFADADDFYNVGFLNVLDNVIDKYKYFDLAIFDVNSVYSDNLHYSKRHLYFSELITNCFKFKTDECIENALLGSWVPWNKLFNKNFIQQYNIKFEEIIAGNDAMFVILSGTLSRSIVVINETLYCVTDRPNSLVKTFSINVYLSRMLLQHRVNLLFEVIDKSYRIRSSYSYLIDLINNRRLFNFVTLFFVYTLKNKKKTNVHSYKLEYSKKICNYFSYE